MCLSVCLCGSCGGGSGCVCLSVCVAHVGEGVGVSVCLSVWLMWGREWVCIYSTLRVQMDSVCIRECRGH